MGGRLAVYTALLFGSWYFNAYGVPDGQAWGRTEPRVGYLGNDSHLVLARLARTDAGPLDPLAERQPDGSSKAYRSQFGLTGVVLAAVRQLTGLEPAALGAVFALLTALVAAAVFAAAHRVLGPPTGDVACAFACTVPIFLPFAASLYWATFLLIAPFAAVWCLLPRAAGGTRRTALLALVGGLVAAKSLCGYEYITTVILAPVAAAWFHQHRKGEPPRARVLFAGGLVASGLIGFALAMVLHAAQVWAVSGEDGFAVIRERAVARTTKAPAGEVAGSDAGPVACFRSYFDQRALSVPAGLDLRRADVPLKWVAAVALALAAAGWVGRLPREAAALSGAVVIGLAAAVSWQVLAVNHMCVHRHINMIVFAVAFFPVAFVAAGYAIRLVLGGVAGRWAGRLTLALAAGLMGWNVALTERDRANGRAEQRRAEAAVAEQLAAPEVRSQRAAGCVDVVRTADRVQPALLLEFGILDEETAAPRDPAALVIQGWALADRTASRRPTARVVAAVGGAVVGCEVIRFGRPDLLRSGQPLPGAGFVLIVPSAALRPGEPVRVFAVAAGNPEGGVTELTPPR